MNHLILKFKMYCLLTWTLTSNSIKRVAHPLLIRSSTMMSISGVRWLIEHKIVSLGKKKKEPTKAGLRQLKTNTNNLQKDPPMQREASTLSATS